MKLVLITDRYVPEARAAAYLCGELAEGLAGRGHEVTVLTRFPSGFVPSGVQGAISASETVNGVQVVRVPGLSDSSSLLVRALDQIVVALRMTWHLLKLRNLDSVLVSSPPLPMTIPAIITKKLHGTRYSLYLYDLYPQTAIDLGILKNKLVIALLRWLERAAYLNSARVIAAAPTTLRMLKEYDGLLDN